MVLDTQRLDVRADDRGPVRLLAIGGELDLLTAPRLASHVDAARRAGARRVVVDLRHLAFCDSTGIRALLGAAAEIRAAGGRLVLLAPEDGAVGRVLRITGVHEVLPVHADEATALAALEPRRD